MDTVVFVSTDVPNTPLNPHAAVEITWTILSSLFASFDGGFLPVVQAQIAEIIGLLGVPAVLAVTIWLAGTIALDLMGQSGGEPLLIIVKRMVRAVIMLTMLGAAAYNELFTDFILIKLPAGVATIAGGGSTPAAFDKMFNSGWVGVVTIYNNAGSLDLKSFGLIIYGGVLAIVGSLGVLIGFVVYLSAHVLSGLALIIGPLAVLCFLWEHTLFIFSGWIKALLGLVVIQLLMVILLSVMTGVVQNTIDGMVQAANANDIMGTIHSYLVCTALFVILGFVALKVESLGGQIVSAGHVGISSAIGAAHGAVASGVRAAAGGGVSRGASSSNASGGGSGNAGMRNATPAGAAT